MCSLRYFFTAMSRWAGRSARYDRRVRNAEAAGSNPARSITRTGLNWIDFHRIYWQRKVKSHATHFGITLFLLQFFYLCCQSFFPLFFVWFSFLVSFFALFFALFFILIDSPTLTCCPSPLSVLPSRLY